jgi:pyruvate formate lyase activating enzyme
MQHDDWYFVRGLTKMSLCDWPGKVCAVLFTCGCNLRCPTCHNGELAWRPQNMPPLGRDAVMNFLESRKAWLDGITVTGGEPSVIPGLASILADLRTLGLPIKLDTNGQRPEVVAELLGARLVDVFAVDVKGPYAKYPELTGGGVSAEKAQEHMSAIFSMAEQHPNQFYFRTTRVPILTDTDMEIARELLPAGFTLTEQRFVEPGRTHAQTDSETGLMSGDVVDGQDSQRHTQSAQGQRSQGPAAVQAAGA